MSDTESTPSGNGGAGGAPEGGPQQPPLSINAQYVKDVSFENPNAPASLTALDQNPDINVNVDVRARRIGEDVFEVELEVKARAMKQAETVFLCELVYAGLFTIKGLPQEHVEPVLLIECPRLLFPYARSVLSTITREGGFPPLMLHPVDFLQMYQNSRQQAQQAATAGPSPADA